ncbi:hypothetical protein NFX46_24280 [Streptomyces phaeoluteigriseus]|uniref:Low molecular weight antigen MTB12-like C-terminal domain-containing protein n=1 Tax=Streptomyces phaeoluteigriseus TaxID=114686 RepID=A0ABY4ZC43_9ACTN|nr:hypothetical protein [Streptomyces phaeoluteigriseus]USQ86546.1 hypothetical protein NFX46_24280 [Streptomyces phaeoluteigriseus]
MSPATRRAACWAAAAALVLVGSCGSGGDGDDAARTTPAPPPTGSTAPTTAGSTPPPTAQSPTPTGTAPEDPDGAERDVRAAWAALFDPESSVDDRSEVVEDGPQNALMIENLFADRLGSRLRATVTSVAFTTSQDATVGYTLSRDGGALDPGGPGAAVRQGDTWKVALRTVCALTRHAEDAPRAPSCDETGEPSATAGTRP